VTGSGAKADDRDGADPDPRDEPIRLASPAGGPP